MMGMKSGMGNGEKNQMKNRVIDGTVFALLLMAVSFVTLKLFLIQVSGDTESDMYAYILEMQGLESRYSFPYPVFFKLAALVHLFAPPELSVAVAVTLLNGLGMVVAKLAFNRLLLPELEKGHGAGFCAGWGSRVLISLLAVSLFFISMLYPPKGIYLPGIRFRCVGVFSANPFHNATYMAARPFAILAFLWYVKLLPGYEKGVSKAMAGDYVLFSLFLLIATMTKPSFTLVLISAAGLLMLYRLVRSKGRCFVPTVQLGLCFIPTFLDLLYQYKGVFVPEDGQERGLGFGFGEVWADYCGNIPLGICLAIGFPLLVLVLNAREWKKNTMLRFSWLLYLVSFAEAFLLYEKGFRKVDFNFSWGYMYGIFFCHFSSLLLLAQLTAKRWVSRPWGNGAKKQGKGSLWGWMLLAMQWGAYLWHLACGIFYFKDLLYGGTYY